MPSYIFLEVPYTWISIICWLHSSGLVSVNSPDEVEDFQDPHDEEEDSMTTRLWSPWSPGSSAPSSWSCRWQSWEGSTRTRSSWGTCRGPSCCERAPGGFLVITMEMEVTKPVIPPRVSAPSPALPSCAWTSLTEPRKPSQPGLSPRQGWNCRLLSVWTNI